MVINVINDIKNKHLMNDVRHTGAIELLQMERVEIFNTSNESPEVGIATLRNGGRVITV